jgi:acyl-CoA reductase-like NAD-dependent aldehyde dehydrogenase
LGGERRKGGGPRRCARRTRTKESIAKVAQAGAADVRRRRAALEAQKSRASTPIHERLAIFLRAAELLTTGTARS